jgi:hypothetical protein
MSTIFNVDVVSSSENSVKAYKIAQCHNPDDNKNEHKVG